MFSYKILLLTFLLLFFSAGILLGQHFNNDKIIDSSTIGTRFQTTAAIDIGPNGAIGIVSVHESQESNFQSLLVFYKSSDHGEDFSKTLVDSIPYEQGGFYQSSILYNYNGIIWITSYIWDEVGPIALLFIYKSTDGGVIFEKTFLGYTQPTFGNFLTADTLGNVFILWQPNGDWLNSTKIVEGNILDTIKTVIPTPGLSIWDSGYDIVVDKAGNNVFVVLDGGTDPDSNHYFIYKVFFVKSTDGGLSFSEPNQIDITVSDSTYQNYADITLWNNKICIAWSDSRLTNLALYYTESNDNGNTFSPSIKISTLETEPVIFRSFLDSNKEQLNVVWYNQAGSKDTYFSQKNIVRDTFLLPIQVGDINYHSFNQHPYGVAADNEGYTYILFGDNRYAWPCLFISRAKFIISSVTDYKPTPELILFQNYPNPFNSVTIIKYAIPFSGRVLIKIYDILGNEICKLYDAVKTSGEYEIQWDGMKYSSGIYYYTIQNGNTFQTKKLVLLK